MTGEVQVSEYKMLFTPGKIGNVTIKNRIVMSPMLVGFGRIDGTATEQLLDYYEERAKGGAGLIITEITRVDDKTGAGAFAQLAASHDYHIEGLKKLADRIHAHGSKVFVQLHHPGRQNVGLLVGTVPLSIKMQKAWSGYTDFLYKITPKLGKKLIEKNIVPSSVCPSKVEPSYFAGGHVRALRKSEIKKIIEEFAEGALRVKKSGCDGVELHGTHGYLIQQFLSPHTNRRTDEYGGSFENRMRFVLEIIKRIRELCGEDFPVVVRLSVDECYDKIGRKGTGYGLDEGVRIAKKLEEAGIDAIDVSCASYDAFNYWLEPTSFETGWRKYMAKAVKDAVNIPVIAANLIRSPEQAEAQLKDGTQDFVSLGRPHIADPHWAEKAESGRECDIKRCICCLYCIESMQENAYIGGHGKCSVNPRVGRERETAQYVKDGDGRKVVIVGAGVAGLTCAEVLANRGFDVTVLEKESEAGGQLQLANKPPKKDKITWAIEDLLHSATSAGAKILYETEATRESVQAMEPYAVIVATGGVALKPRGIEGVELDSVCTTTEILDGEIKLAGKKVAVIGSGMTGLETAELLAEQGNEVIIVDMANEVAPGTWMQHKDDILPKLESAGVKIYLGEKLLKITENSIITESVKGRKTKEFCIDNVVLSLGARSVNGLAKELEGASAKVIAVGDAVKIGRIADATGSAFDVAWNLK